MGLNVYHRKSGGGVSRQRRERAEKVREGMPAERAADLLGDQFTEQIKHGGD